MFGEVTSTHRLSFRRLLSPVAVARKTLPPCALEIGLSLTPEVVPELARQALVKRLIAVHIPFAAVHVAWLKKTGLRGGYSQRISEVVRPSSQRR